MTVKMNTRFDKDYVTQLSKQKNEPEWMLKLRLQALELYNQLPIPYLEKTKIDNWNIDNFSFYQSESIDNLEKLPENIRSIIDINSEERNLLIQSNSNIIYEELMKEMQDKGVIFKSLDTAVREFPDLVQKYFMNAVKIDENKLIALHTALWNDGVFLYVPKNIEVELPMQALYLADASGITPHIIIVAEENSKVTYVDKHFSSSPLSAVHNSVIEVYVGKGAKVRFATIHNFGRDMYDYTYRRALVDKDGKIEWIIGEMNLGNTVSNNTSILTSSAASAESKSIFVGTGKQRTNFVSKVIHIGDHTESNILSRGVLLEQAVGTFNGITEIKKGAAKSSAEQVEKVLMLSKDARGDANPILLIDEYDVVAGHAASAGPVNPNDIFYLMSRGIPKQEAEKLLLRGFLAPVVSQIPIVEMKEQLEELIERKLTND